MRRYGGLARLMPVTFVTFGLAYLAIIGIPPFSAFFTKDPVIDAAFSKGGTSGALLGTAALIGAGLTSFYMTRMMFMTFAGRRRWEEQARAGGAEPRTGQPQPEGAHGAPHPHESPQVMLWPMILLAVGSVGAGAFLIINSRLIDFLAPVTGAPPKPHGIFTGPGLGALGLALVAVVIAWAMYGRREVPAAAPRGRFPVVAARKDLYGDAFNESVLMRPGQWLTRLSVYFDNRGIDGLVNTVAATVGGSSGRLRRVQTGFVRSYALAMFAGAALFVCALLLVRL